MILGRVFKNASALKLSLFGGTSLDRREYRIQPMLSISSLNLIASVLGIASGCLAVAKFFERNKGLKDRLKALTYLLICTVCLMVLYWGFKNALSNVLTTDSGTSIKLPSFFGAHKEELANGVTKWTTFAQGHQYNQEVTKQGYTTVKKQHFRDGKLHGKYETWHRNGNKEATGYYDDGEREGPWHWYRETGQLYIKGSYKDDLYDGKWIWKYDNGQPLHLATFKDGKQVGEETTFNRDGSLVGSGVYKDGKKWEGTFCSIESTDHSKITEITNFKNGEEYKLEEVRYDNGNLRSRIQLVDGKRDGIATWWYENGEKQVEQIFSNGILEGERIAWDRDGNLLGTIECRENQVWDGRYVEFNDLSKDVIKISNYKSGMLHGLYETWHNNGKPEYKAKYIDGKRDGVATWWDENGIKWIEQTYSKGGIIRTRTAWDRDGKVIGEIEYKDGERWSGRYVEFNDESKDVIQISNYRDGKWHGLYETWYKNGKLKSKLNYLEGRRDGVARWWYDNGEKRLECNYSNGEFDGKRTAWDRNGKLLGELECKDNVRWDGQYVGFNDESKSVVEISNYRDGKTHGQYETWYADGKPKHKSNYVNGKQDGLVTWWYDNEEKRLEYTSKNGKIVGKCIAWGRDGKVLGELEYKDGEPWEGKLVEFDDSGKTEITVYEDGKKVVTK